VRQLASNPAVQFGCVLCAGLAVVGLIGRYSGTGPATSGPAAVAKNIVPKPFTSKEGKTGWVVVLPGESPLATPAVVDGKVFVAGGFGSSEFHALDAQTGMPMWTHRARNAFDDQLGGSSPTSPAIAAGHVVFNTRFGEPVVLDLDGRNVSRKGSPYPVSNLLVSMPAMHDGKVYTAYPDPTRPMAPPQFLCFDADAGRDVWKQRIAGDVITAPVVAGGHVLVAMTDGTLACLAADTGTPAWSEKKNATAAPAVVAGKVYFTRRETVTGEDRAGNRTLRQKEVLVCRNLADGATRRIDATARRADYLDAARRKAASELERTFQQADGLFRMQGHFLHPRLGQAEANLGQTTAVGVWSYQGSHPAAAGGKVYVAMGDTLHCVDAAGEKLLWSKCDAATGPDEALVDPAFTPPAVANRKLFVGTRAGQVVCLAADTGAELFRVTVGEPVLFQPAVAAGRVYVGTSSGKLFCVETGDPADDGWPMWGGTATRNGVQ
jgi:outer membrane protein assembly factor BamB